MKSTERTRKRNLILAAAALVLATMASSVNALIIVDGSYLLPSGTEFDGDSFDISLDEPGDELTLTGGTHDFLATAPGATITIAGSYVSSNPDLGDDVTQIDGWYGTIEYTYTGISGSYFVDVACDGTIIFEGGSTPPEPTEIEVTIDIKPGSDPNPINQGSNGLVPVAIFGTADFDVCDIDPGTVTLAGAEVATRGKANKYMWHFEDVNADGFLDVVLQVEVQSEGAAWVSGPVELLGATYDEVVIFGYDAIVVVPPEI